MKKNLLRHTLLILSCILLTALGFTVLNAYSTTTIGLDINTGSITSTGTITSQDLTIEKSDDTTLTIYSNTDSPTENDKLLIIQKGTTPSELFSVDEDGDVIIANDLSINNDLAITGNVTSGTWQGTAITNDYIGTGIDTIKLADGSVSNDEFQYLDGAASALQTQLDNKIAIPGSSAQGDVLFRNDTEWTRLAAGTNGQFLKSQGASSDPAWTNVTRSATFVVAANDSSTLSKQQADYVCDGTDDQEEIQAAIDALPDGGGKVVLMEGTYNTSAKISTVNNLYLAGMGWNTIIKIGDVSSQGVIVVTSKSNVIIENLKLDGNRTAQSVPNLVHEGVDFTSSTDCLVRNVLIVDCAADGIDIDGGTNIAVVGCTIKNCRGGAVHISTDNPQYMRVLNVYSESNGAELTRPAFDVYSDGAIPGGDYNYFEGCISVDDYQGFKIGGDNTPTHNTIINCQVYSSTDDAIIVNGIRNRVIGCAVDTTGGYSIKATGDFNIIANNNINNPVSHSIYSTGDHCVIEGNIICSPNMDKGMCVGGNKVVISSNYVECITGTAFTTIGLVDSIVQGNMIEAQGRGINFTGDSSNNLIINNNIKKSSWTVYLYSGCDNNVFKSNIFQTGGAGVINDLGSGNIFYEQYSDLFMDLLAASTTAIHAAITGTGAAQEVTTAITNPDVARNISITTSNVTSPSGNVTITGVDAKGNSTTEDIAISAGSTAYGSKAFATVSKITIPAGVTADDTVAVGISDKLGLSNIIYASGDVYKVKKNNADATIGTVNTTYGTVDCANITGADDFTIYYKSNLNIIN